MLVHQRSSRPELLYVGALPGLVEYAETTCDAVLIVSAFYGLVTPDQVLRPYDRSLAIFSKREREDWGVRTIGQLPMAFQKRQLVILAGKLYAEALAYGAHWHDLSRPEEPLRGISGVGQRVSWLKAKGRLLAYCTGTFLASSPLRSLQEGGSLCTFYGG